MESTETTDPDWLTALRAAALETSQGAVAKALNISKGAVNQLLRGRYMASNSRMEQRVREVLMPQKQCCPHMVGRLVKCEGCPNRKESL